MSGVRAVPTTTDQRVAVEALEAVAAACAAVDGTDPFDEADRIRLRRHGLDGDRLWLADDAAGFALRHAGALTLAVRPDARGRGVGRALLDAAVEEPGPLTAWSHGDDPAAAALASTHGFDRARALWVMRRPTAGAPPLAPTRERAGTTVRSWRPEDEAGLLATNAAAFADHPEQGAMDADDLHARMAEPWFDPAGLFVADGGTRGIEGFHWTKVHPRRDPSGPLTGEVYVVGIAPAAQGSGLGRTLTLTGLHHLVEERGVDEVLLYVESDNAPAVALYSGLGFTHADEDTHVQYRR